MHKTENKSENKTMRIAEIQKKLSEFNRDPKIQAIREYYTKKSFIEILSKSRNETTHSAFLGWLLQGDAFTKEDAPLMRFLDVLINNMNGFDSELNNNNLKAAILSRTLDYSDVKVTLEQTVKEISNKASKDRLDIYLTAKLNEKIGGKENLRIIIENKVFSEEKKGDEKATDEDKKLSQTQRYFKAVQENPKDEEYCKNTFSIYVFLTPDGTKATDTHFISVTYKDIMEYVLEPLAASTSLDDSVKLYIEEYIKALTVPSISDTDNELTVLAVSEKEKEQIKTFWRNYQELIRNAAESNDSKDTTSENLVLQKFYERNQPFFMAIYYILDDKPDFLKKHSTRDYTKYTLLMKGTDFEYNHLGKRQVVLKAAEYILNNEGEDGLSKFLYSGNTDKYNRVFYYKKQDFDEQHKDGKISDDAYYNRYTIKNVTKDSVTMEYVILNQWGSGNWDFVEDLLANKGFTLESE